MRHDEGFSLYSIGNDERDDRGSHNLSDGYFADRGDIVFRGRGAVYAEIKE